MLGVEIQHLIHFCLKCVKSALERPREGVGSMDHLELLCLTPSLPEQGNVDPAVLHGSSMTNPENCRDICHGRAVKSPSSLGMRNLPRCSPGCRLALPSWPESTFQQGQAGREAGGKQKGRQGYPGFRKSEGAVLCLPTPFNLPPASTVGSGFEHPQPFIHTLWVRRSAGKCSVF